MRLVPASEGQWPGAPCALQQHPLYGGVIRRLGGRAMLYRLTDAEGDVAWLQCLVRGPGRLRLSWFGRGPVWLPGTDEARRRQAAACLPALLPGLSLILPEDETTRAALAGARLRAMGGGRRMAEMDLTPPEAERLAAQHGKWRNRLRRAERAGLRVRQRPLDWARDEGLLARELAQRRARRYTALPPAFTRLWAERDPTASRLFVALEAGRPVAFMLVLLHAPVATYHIGWSGPEGRRVSAHHLLLWEAARWLSERGFIRFDLGDACPETAPGLARFKRGSGARLRQLAPTYLRLPRLSRRGRAFALAIRGSCR